MTRKDFINILYNNGRGLTLDQIKTVDEDLIETVPDGMINDIMEDLTQGKHITLGEEHELFIKAREQALEQARDVCVDAYADTFIDPIEVKEYFRNYVGIGELPDDNCVGLFYSISTRL